MLTAKLLQAMKPAERTRAIMLERRKCYSNLKYLIETYFTVDAGGTRKPFILFPHQKKALSDYLRYPNNITMKTRQMGFTTFTSAYVAAELINKNNFKALVISKEMKSSKSFLKTIKDILDEARKLTRLSEDQDSASWLIPDYKEGYNNKESFELENGSQAHAQGNTEDAGRGFPGLNLAIVDEVAFIDRKSPNRMNDIWAALGPALSTVKGKTIMISTPFGSSGWYYDTYTNAKEMGFNIIEAHWTVHPLFNQGMYQWVVDNANPEGGYVKYYNETWPEELFDRDAGVYIETPKDKYNYVKDGRIRSPWYDFESKKLGPRKTACELDCTFTGTGGEVLDPDILRAMKMYSASSAVLPYNSSLGLMEYYTEFIKPKPDGKYVLAADVSTGDGSDFSTVAILDLYTLDVSGTFKGQLLPNAFGRVIFELAKRFNNCQVVVENAGGGGTTLQELKDLKYPNIYYSTLNKKDESLGVKKRKIGLWVSEEVRGKGGDKLEMYIRDGKVNIPCTRLASEFNNWIWDKDGKRRHAPGKHDDLITALQHAIYYHAYVFKRNDRNRQQFADMFSIQRNGEYYNPNSAGSGFVERDEYNPFQGKRNNGRDIIEDKSSFLSAPVPPDQRRGMFL